MAERLARLAVHQVRDLLFLLPLRYEDRTRLWPIGGLIPGTRVTIDGTVDLTEVVMRGRRSLLCSISDGTGSITLRFFHFSRAQQKGLSRGARLRCFGEVRKGPARLEMVHPEYQRLAEDEEPDLEERLTPYYPATEGLQQPRLRRFVQLALDALGQGGLEELIPAEASAALGFPDLDDALRFIHRPPVGTDPADLQAGSHPALRRLAFEELLAHQVALRRLREKVRAEQAWPLPGPGPRVREFVSRLPFALTGAQQRVLDEVSADMSEASPMLRLVQGDVGSGKTVIAAAAAVQAVEAGAQAAVMAPTELLAEQHHRSLRAWLEPLGIRVAWLASRLPAAARREALEALASGSAGVAVGTHALFQDGVEFDRLALAIIDEQHRFGVHQRLALSEKGTSGAHRPHQLIMTATPIPRTLAMATYADLDTSIIDELPPGRGSVQTVVLPESRRDEVIERIREACAHGRQAYWVCPLVEESDALEARAAEETSAGLAAALPGLRVGLVHGRLRPVEKEAAMSAFASGTTDLLVATTVIEVGVDVPNASLMIIENAERMGLAQLHQLRGRIGRGKEDSSCLLLYKSPLSDTARARLATIRETRDGFEVARRDLELRGPGEVLGIRQTGLMQMRVADLMRDQKMIPDVQRVADDLLSSDPERADRLTARWIGAAERYAQV